MEQVEKRERKNEWNRERREKGKRNETGIEERGEELMEQRESRQGGRKSGNNEWNGTGI
jgi:hypothetical protein